MDAVVVGTLLRVGDQLRVSTQLLDTPSGTVRWSGTSRATIGNLFDLEDRVVRDIVSSLALPLSQREHDDLSRDVPKSAKAFEFYLRAVPLSADAKSWKVARDLLRECVRSDPTYAPAWARLGRVYRLLGKFSPLLPSGDPTRAQKYLSDAESALNRALALNPTLALADSYYAQLELDLGQAEAAMVRLLRRASIRTTHDPVVRHSGHRCLRCDFDSPLRQLVLRVRPQRVAKLRENACACMDTAYKRLRQFNVEHASTGPQKLPAWNANAGGISAFYFRDPDRHFLEILHFPADKGLPKWHGTDRLFLGIDHTAIVVGDTDQSLRLYRDALQMRVVGESENYDTEQEHLNNVFGARLRITAVRAEHGPGIELLEYLAPRDGRSSIDVRANDAVHWQTTLIADAPTRVNDLLRQRIFSLVSPNVIDLPTPALALRAGILLRDPDGHGLIVGSR